MHKDLKSRNDTLNSLFIIHVRRGRPSSTYLPTSYLPPLYSIVYAHINILCALVPYNTTIIARITVDMHIQSIAKEQSCWHNYFITYTTTCYLGLPQSQKKISHSLHLCLPHQELGLQLLAGKQSQNISSLLLLGVVSYHPVSDISISDTWNIN